MRNVCSIQGCGHLCVGRGWCREHYYRWRRHGDPLAGRVSQGAPLEWLQAHVNHVGDDCLIWPFRRGGRGYAYLADGPACRVMCEMAHGPAPSPQHDAAHSCGMGHMGCINQRHLRWATTGENAQDKFIHGTQPVGSQIGWAKLTEDDVRAIRNLRHRTHSAIADEFGVCRQLISQILSGKIWRHVE